jgi:ligand-binding SRPBCC domain-containing protein
MKLHTIIRKQKIYSDIYRVWDFFSSPMNLRIITPDWLNFVVISDLPDKMYPGMIVEYRVSPIFNIPVRWITEITHVDEPFYFVDEQRFGPYKFWHHKHFFIQKVDHVEMVDKVDYILPYGVFGEFFYFYVNKKLLNIFDYRYKRIDELFNKF